MSKILSPVALLWRSGFFMLFGLVTKVARNLVCPAFERAGRLQIITLGDPRNALLWFRTLQGRFALPEKRAASIAPREGRAPF